MYELIGCGMRVGDQLWFHVCPLLLPGVHVPLHSRLEGWSAVWERWGLQDPGLAGSGGLLRGRPSFSEDVSVPLLLDDTQ